jgi:hypothetical protein
MSLLPLRANQRGRNATTGTESHTSLGLPLRLSQRLGDSAVKHFFPF